MIEVRQQHCLLHAEQCPTVVKDVSILLSTFLCPFSKFFQEHVLKKKQNGIPFQVAAPLVSHTELVQLHTHLIQDLGPVIIFFLEILIQLERLHCKIGKKKSNSNFG